MFEYIHHIAYVVSDMEDAVRTFSERFKMELSERRVMQGERSFEMAAFRCGPTLIELMRPINHPELARFLAEHGPGLHHVAFAVRDLSKRVQELKQEGVFVSEPFVAATGWKTAYFDLEKSGLTLFRSSHHGDHLAEADTIE
jgi:methylmalonyl-CoA/ethylmalonyl-CoA epimerase